MRLRVYSIPAVAMSLALGIVLMAPSSAAPANIWYKLCTKSPLMASSADAETGDICQTLADVRDNKTAVLIGRVAIRQLPGQAGYELEALIPLGSALPPGALVKIDGREPIKLAFKRCDAGGCYAYAAIGDPVIAQMKSGKQLAYLAVDVVGRALNIPLPLAGFAEAFDGPPAALEKSLAAGKRMAEVIAKRRAEAGKAPQNAAPARSQLFAAMGKNPTVNTGWYKLCPEISALRQQYKAGDAGAQEKGRTVCLTQADTRNEDTMVLAGKIAVRKIDGNASWQVAVMLPLGASLADGATVAIDKGEPIKLAFKTCDATGCLAEADIPAGALDQLKSGHEVFYTGTDESGDTLLVPVSLSGFKEAFDGAAMPNEVYNAEMRRIAETISIRAARRRKEQRQ
jgi:invasion protein IalB